MKEPVIYTIGYGNREIKNFLTLMKQYEIEFLIDVRTSPYSKMNPHFNKEPLKNLAKIEGIRYSFFGESLGGKPANENLYYDDGKVNYNKIQEERNFKNSISRLISAYNQGLQVALMCSELNPEECHRSKLIGEALTDKNIKVSHIDRHGKLKAHNDVMLKITKGVNTKDLFGNKSLSSVGTYQEINNSDFEFFTIGVYNSNKDSFFQKLKNYSIDTFIDIRQRRGVRGAKYSHVNSNRLQNELNLLKINYLYFKDLAPNSEIRELQKKADSIAGIEKRNREYLGNTFIREYNSRVLDDFDFSIFFKTLKKIHAKKIVLFCVEEKHTACHRSIVAKKLQEEFNYHSRHL